MGSSYVQWNAITHQLLKEQILCSKIETVRCFCTHPEIAIKDVYSLLVQQIEQQVHIKKQKQKLAPTMLKTFKRTP